MKKTTNGQRNWLANYCHTVEWHNGVEIRQENAAGPLSGYPRTFVLFSGGVVSTTNVIGARALIDELAGK